MDCDEASVIVQQLLVYWSVRRVFAMKPLSVAILGSSLCLLPYIQKSAEH